MMSWGSTLSLSLKDEEKSGQSERGMKLAVVIYESNRSRAQINTRRISESERPSHGKPQIVSILKSKCSTSRRPGTRGQRHSAISGQRSFCKYVMIFI